MASEQEEAEVDSDAIQTLPEVPDDGVLIKTLYAGVCHATHSLSDDLDLASFVGHEVCGKVLSLGSKVPDDKGPRVGDVVVVYPWPGCGQCETCSTENWQLCDEQQLTGDHASPVPPAETNSSLASFQVVSHWRRVISLPRDYDIAPQVGCLLPCGALRVYAALRHSRSCFDTAVRIRGFANLLVVAGDSVDGLELWTVLLVKNVLCDRNVKVVCASRRQDVVDRAVQAGADDAVFLPAESSVSQLTDATTMSGYNRIDVSFDQHDQLLTLDELVRRGVTLRPVVAGSLEQLRELVDVLAVQGVTVNIPVECYRPDELQTVVERLHRRTVNGRIVIKYD